MAVTASVVCSELEHEVPGVGGLTEDAGHLGVADLADHDHVRVLAQHRTQHRRVGAAGAVVHRDLGDAGHLTFDRVFDRDDVHGAGTEDVERAVERGGLARPGRAGDQHEAVRPDQRLAQPHHDVGRVSELVHRAGTRSGCR